MSFLDILLTLIYLVIAYAIGNNIKNKNSGNPLYKKWFIKGLSAKLWGGLAFALVYTYYFDYGGDTRAYHRDALLIAGSLGKGVFVFWEVLQHQYNNVSSEALDVLLRLSFAVQSEYYISNLTSVFTVLGGGSYFSSTLLVALFTYWGMWHFFLLLVEKFPQLEKQMAFSVLFIPSVFFWGSGISKDSFILCCVGLFLYHINQVFSGKFWKLNSILILVLTSYFMFIVKPYVIVSLAPAVALWRTLYLRDKIRNVYIRAAVLPIIGGVAIVAMVYTLSVLAQYNARYSVDSFVNTAQSMQGWHYVEGDNSADSHGRGSSYTLGEYDETSWQGMLKIFPAAVNVTYFRPYIWEVSNAGMLAQALESLAFLIFAVYTILKVGPLRTYRFISGDSFLLMCVVFAVFFGFAVGFSSYNFGALSRYKIPCVPFFVAALFIIRFKSEERVRFTADRFAERRRKGAVTGFVGS